MRDQVVLLGAQPTEPDPELGYLSLGASRPRSAACAAVSASSRSRRPRTPSELLARRRAVEHDGDAAAAVDALWELGRAADPQLIDILDSLVPLSAPTTRTRRDRRTSTARSCRSASRATSSSARPSGCSRSRSKASSGATGAAPSGSRPSLALRRRARSVAGSRREPVATRVVTRRHRAGLAGPAVSARRDVRRLRARTSRCTRASPSASSCACSTATASSTSTLGAGHRLGVARVPARGRPGPGATAFASTARGIRRAGLRCNPDKLLVDPYARAISRGPEVGSGAARRRRRRQRRRPRTARRSRFARWSRSRTSTGATIAGSRSPWNETVIYEVHVKGFTSAHPDVPERAARHVRRARAPGVDPAPARRSASPRSSCCRSTRSSTTASCSSAACATTGATTRSATSRRTPSTRACASTTGAVAEFKQMVRALHQAGIEVILDVVYNHTAEGNHEGPTLSMRGLDNPAYYRLVADNPAYYMDYTGTGNTLNMRHPHVLQLVMDSLRYWVEEMHVDGFRFDLASALARGLHEVDRLGAFFDLIQQDPVVSRVKLIAEPWDVGEGGYQVGNFPPLWSEWNGKYRDWIRDYWRGEPGSLPELGARFTGSSRSLRSGRAVPARDASTSSPRTTASRCATSSRTTRSTTRRTARTTATARATTARGTAASRARPTIPRSSRCAAASSATCSRRCSCRKACRCCSAATSSAARSAATTTRTARTTRSRGSTGRTPISELLAFVRGLAAAAPRAPGVSPARLVPGPADPAAQGRHGAARHRVARRPTATR